MSQHLEALERANKIRLARSNLKREIRSGEASVIDVIANPPAYAASMRVVDLIRAQHGWGEAKSRLLLGSMYLSPLKHVGELTVRQRNELVARLGGVNAASAARKVA